MNRDTEQYLLNRIKFLEKENKDLSDRLQKAENTKQMALKLPALKPGNYNFTVEEDGLWCICAIEKKK